MSSSKHGFAELNRFDNDPNLAEPNETFTEMPDNIEAIEAVRAILVEQLSAILTKE